MKRRVAILISGRGSNMTALVEAAKAEGFPAEIAVVISNKSGAEGLARAQAAGIATLVIESKSFGKDRAAFESKLQAALDENRVELICLAGFMRLFTAEFVQRWHGRMLNIHPSLLPSFPGLDPHGQALRAGVKVSG
ncbi:MAG TPA: phosphoribosylglycinamide formyltransferase, partial [Nitrobacter sp.]|nr:phosphoribosylglycinamide formyltransferase [Nitrobacter sp.]